MVAPSLESSPSRLYNVVSVSKFCIGCEIGQGEPDAAAAENRPFTAYGPRTEGLNGRRE